MGDFSADDYVLKYTPTNADNSTRTVKGRGRQYVSSFYSVSGKFDHMVHGNSSISVQFKGRDVTDKSNTWRQWRIWSLTSDSGFNATLPPDSDWEDDNLTGNANWLDIPGYLIVPSPDKWKTERKMLEFVAAVDGHLDSGILYFFVVVSLKKNQYRIEMSSSKRIEYEDWRPLKHSQQPQPSGCNIQIDSTWMTVKDSLAGRECRRWGGVTSGAGLSPERIYPGSPAQCSPMPNTDPNIKINNTPSEIHPYLKSFS